MSLSHRFFDSLLPITTWFVITLPIWLSPFHPAVVSYFIITFDIYFLYKSIITAFLSTLSYQKILSKKKFPFAKKLSKIKKSSEIHHFVIIPNYKEPLLKLKETINAIKKSDYPSNKICLILAFEQREKHVVKKAKELTKKYSSYFKELFTYFHSLQKDEIAGKASNQTYAAKLIDQFVEENKIDPKKVLITICDADSLFPKNYFSYLTYQFLKDKQRNYHFYWAPVLLYNNFWQLPFFVRIQATISSLVRLAFLSYKKNLIQISTYSTNLWLLRQINFWDVDIIPEDWHVYLQAFFKFGEKIKTIPLFTLINGDAVYSGNFFKTLTNRYEQEKRWAWGVSDIGYSLKNFFSTPHINPWVKIKKIIFLAETHLLWPSSFFILTISAFIPPLINPVFKRTVLGFFLPKLTGLILTLSSLMLVLYIYLDIKLREKIKIYTKTKKLPFLIIQWYFLPVISFLLSSLPALDAHTRLLLGKKLKYKVTKKI